MQSLLHDIRYALRQLRKSPGFTITAVLTLALGIGANTAIFSMLDSVLLEPLPFAHPASLVKISGFYPKGWVRAAQQRAQSFSSIAAYTLNSEYNLAGSTSTDRVFSATVTTNLLSTLGVATILGRDFAASEATAGADQVAIVSHSYWKQQMGADPHAIGSAIRLDGVSRRIIGVLPAGIQFPDSETQILIPASFKPGDPIDPWAMFRFQMIGRLRQGIQPQQAQAELRTLHPQLLRLFPWRMPDDWYADVDVVPLIKAMAGDAGQKLLLLSCAVGLVLLIACANVANLMLARAAARQREMAVRSALGATTVRLVRQVLAESLVLAAAGGAAGLLLARFSLASLKLLLLADSARAGDIAIHARVFLFVAFVTLMSSIFFGVVPAWRAAHAEPQLALKTSVVSRASRAGRINLPVVLVVGQLALAIAVITSAGVLLHSLWRLSHVDPGFRTDKIVVAQVSLDQKAFGATGHCADFFASLLDRARAMPGVQQAALVDQLPLRGYDADFAFDAEGHPRAGNQTPEQGSARMVSPDYFRLVGIRVLRGRVFNGSDANGQSRAMVINKSLADHLWPGQDVIGKRLIWVGQEGTQGVLDPNAAWVVTGVVSNTLHDSLAVSSGWEMYYPSSRKHDAAVMNVLIGTDASTGEIAAGLRNIVKQMDPAVPVTNVMDFSEVVSASLTTPRSLATLLSIFALLALALGILGVYSLISYLVSGRTAEIGIRLALGARREQIVGLVLRQTLLLVVGGSVAGLAVAFAVSRFLGSLLYQTSPIDPLTYILVPFVLALSSLLAAGIPALRAAKVEPMHALRAD